MLFGKKGRKKKHNIKSSKIIVGETIYSAEAEGYNRLKDNVLPLIRILPIARPATIMKNRRLSGERSIVRQDIIHHQTTAYARGGYHATSSALYRSACQRDSARRTIPHNRASFQAHPARSPWSGRYRA